MKKLTNYWTYKSLLKHFKRIRRWNVHLIYFLAKFLTGNFSLCPFAPKFRNHWHKQLYHFAINNSVINRHLYSAEMLKYFWFYKGNDNSTLCWFLFHQYNMYLALCYQHISSSILVLRCYMRMVLRQQFNFPHSLLSFLKALLQILYVSAIHLVQDSVTNF